MQLTDKEKKARDYICLALDMADKDEIMKIIDEVWDLVGYFKIHVAFAYYGPEIVQAIKDKGGKVFFDSKYHDIPNTVAHFARAQTSMKTDMFNIHASGGVEMMKAAVQAAEEEAERDCAARPKIIAVTVLTSLDKKTLNAMGVPGEVDEQVIRLANAAKVAGVDGIVCAAADLEQVKPRLGDMFYVTPGIRPVGVSAHDQKRVMTPSNAVKAGSSLLVIGRAIYGAKDRRKAAKEILEDIASVL